MKKLLSLLIIGVMTIISVSIPMTALGDGNNLYTDVADSHWAYEAIKYSTKSKWFNGYSDGSFMPDNTISRAEAVKVLVSFLKRETEKISSSSFIDVNEKDWYAGYVEAGKDLFPVKLDDKRFKPDEVATREDTIYALVKGLQLNITVEHVDQSILEKFKDENKISDDIRPYFTIALQTSLISGYSDGTVKAKNSLTRAEFATLLYRALQISEGKDMNQPTEVIEMTHNEADSYVETNKAKNKDVQSSSFQNEVIVLVNEIRIANGLKELSVSADLSMVAQKKANEMQTNDYFDHISPTYGSPFDMMKSFGISFASAGENIAKGQSTPKSVVDSWMNSEGHKENILNPSYTQIGVGYSANENIWVQMFVG